MNVKKYTNNTWREITPYKYSTSVETYTDLPQIIYANGNSAIIGLKGALSQSGVPSPTNPIQPQGCGDLETTGVHAGQYKIPISSGGVNLAPPLTDWVDGYINSANGTIHTPTESREKTSDFIRVEPNSVYVFSHENGDFPSGDNGTWRVAGLYDVNKQFISRVGSANRLPLTITTTAETTYIRLSFRTYGGSGNTALNLGSEALPYSPYNRTTTTIYLGEVPTTRKIQKYIFTGTEDWKIRTSPDNSYSINFSAINTGGGVIYRGMCSHFTNPQSGAFNIISGQCYFGTSAISFRLDDTTDLTQWTNWVKQQYQNGTPVTVWYVLATPETAVVNEPLMKIGDYADTVSGISIPVTAGGDTLSVDTTVQPSEVTVNYKDWHPVADVHERTNGAWT